MNQTLIRVEWMKSILRLESNSNFRTLSVDEVVSSFACLSDVTKEKYVTYDQWLQNMGIAEQVQQETEAEQNEAALNQLIATAPNATVTREEAK